MEDPAFDHLVGGEGAASHADTAWFGGSGFGNGTVVRGGLWNFEVDSGEPPEFFPDGDPVGNQFRDGWTFEDRTARVGPSQTGAPHFNALGVYDFLKRTSIIRYTQAELQRTAASIDRLARAEGFDAHARAATIRIDN